MAPRFAFPVLAFALLLVGTAASGDGHDGAEFGYIGQKGPRQWGSLSPEYATCKNGTHQSPVDIVKNQVVHSKSLKPLSRDYAPANATLINNGFNVAVLFDGYVGELNVNGKNYSLKHVHWHTPSEHCIDGVRYPAEMHLVHKAADGNISVVGILYKYGAPDAFLSKIKDKLEELGKDKSEKQEEAQVPLGVINAKYMGRKTHEEESRIPLGVVRTKYMERKTRTYYRYMGSLSTPPCSEDIIWNVLGKVRTISEDQVKALKAPLKAEDKENARPLQPLNGRKIELYHELASH